MTHEDFAASIDKVRSLPSAERSAWLTAHPALLTEASVHALKALADEYCGRDIEAALQLADLIQQAATLTGRDDYRALGLHAEGNARSIGHADYALALARFDEALALYRQLGRDVEAAKAVTGRLMPLARLGRLAEAYPDFEWARGELRAHGELRSLAIALINFGALLGDQGLDREALARFDEAAAVLGEIGDPASVMDLGAVEQNRSVVLRNIGRLEDSVAASAQAIRILADSSQPLEEARAKQNLGVTCVELGDYNRGLRLVDEARDAFAGHHLPRQTMRLELYAAGCLLQIGRLQDVIERVAETKAYFAAHHSPLDAGQALYLAALAYLSLGELDEALDELAAAADRFRASGNTPWLARVSRHRAKVLARLGRFGEAREAAAETQQLLDDRDQPLEGLRTRLDMAELALAMGDFQAADRTLAALEAAVLAEPVPLLRFDLYRLQAELAQRGQRPADAMQKYDLALAALEHVRGRLLPEFYGDFLANKQAVYERAAAAAIEAGGVLEALAVVERGKSRALVDSLSGRLRQPVRPRRAEDQPLVAELNQLIAERDRLVRRWQDAEDDLEGLATGGTDDQNAVMRRVAGIERTIEERWRRLLVRSSQYASDTALTQVERDDLGAILATLPADTAGLTYFSIDDRLQAFVAGPAGVAHRELAGSMDEVRPLIRYLHMNFDELPHQPLSLIDQSRHEANGILSRLHQLLVQPIADLIDPFANIVVMPHDDLHYVPFHALRRDDHYLIEERQVAYLPSLHALRHFRGRAALAPRAAVFGRSQDGRLPCTVEEARRVADIWGVAPELEDEATVARVSAAAARCQVLHLATHGSFRPDSPLFSGLSLSDGELTTLRIFNDLDLDGSLVVLSACETGQGTIGGGHELQGLMRAFLYRGAAALVMTLWKAHDAAAVPLMTHYHTLLYAGMPMAEALCDAQRAFLHQARATAQDAYTHPFFWAPFIHVGQLGPIKEETQ